GARKWGLAPWTMGMAVVIRVADGGVFPQVWHLPRLGASPHFPLHVYSLTHGQKAWTRII
ncbi:MAG: hypothetical protein V3V75_07680, partial [Thermoguttaceae bacterium]